MQNWASSSRCWHWHSNMNAVFYKYKSPLYCLKVSSIYFSQCIQQRAVHKFSYHEWQYLILGNASTFDDAPFSEISRSSEQYYTEIFVDLHFDFCLFI